MPSVYHRWEYEVLRFCFEDELGVETTQNLLNTHLSKKFTAPLISKNNSVWFDRVDTAAKEEKSDVMTISFINAYESLIADYGKNSKSWNWGNLHQLEHPHSFGKIALLRPLFNVGPNPIAGAREVINAVNFKYSRTSSNFNANAGPSTRRIIDFSDVEHSISILPTGQSGNPFSDHYDDQVELYNSGKFRPMLLNKEEILKDSKNKLIVH
jgi:penicillin amidase